MEWILEHPLGDERDDSDIHARGHFVCLECAARHAELNLQEVCSSETKEWLFAEVERVDLECMEREPGRENPMGFPPTGFPGLMTSRPRVSAASTDRHAVVHVRTLRTDRMSWLDGEPRRPYEMRMHDREARLSFSAANGTAAAAVRKAGTAFVSVGSKVEVRTLCQAYDNGRARTIFEAMWVPAQITAAQKDGDNIKVTAAVESDLELPDRWVRPDDHRHGRQGLWVKSAQRDWAAKLEAEADRTATQAIRVHISDTSEQREHPPGHGLFGFGTSAPSTQDRDGSVWLSPDKLTVVRPICPGELHCHENRDVLVRNLHAHTSDFPASPPFSVVATHDWPTADSGPVDRQRQLVIRAGEQARVTRCLTSIDGAELLFCQKSGGSSGMLPKSHARHLTQWCRAQLVNLPTEKGQMATVSYSSRDGTDGTDGTDGSGNLEAEAIEKEKQSGGEPDRDRYLSHPVVREARQSLQEMGFEDDHIDQV